MIEYRYAKVRLEKDELILFWWLIRRNIVTFWKKCHHKTTHFELNADNDLEFKRSFTYNPQTQLAPGRYSRHIRN